MKQRRMTSAPHPFAAGETEMGLFLLKRTLTLIGTLIGASVIVFLVLEILPGNAAQMLMGPDASPEAVAALATKLGLDLPAWTRYWHWIGGLLTGNLGDSYAYSSPVLDLILERLALTVPLAMMAMALTVVIALLVGVTAAARHNKLGDVGLMGMAQVGIAIPNFWFAILLILVFSVQLQWFSAGGFEGWGEGFFAGSSRCCCPRCRSPSCRPRSSRASRARPCSR
jgi:peptide/nickel transport system permease protein